MRLPDAIELADPPVRVRLNASPRARRFTLRLAAPGEGAVLTLPPQVPERDARAFLLAHRGWLARALSRQAAAVTVGDGAALPVDGEPMRIRLLPGGPRVPALSDGEIRLSAGRPAGPRLSAWLRMRLRDRVAPLAHDAAGTLGRRITAISFRDTRSRWGSCSSAGRISLSWRLAMAPREVQDYVALHEVAHLAEMNHSARFWAVMARLMPDYETHRAWLREEGRALHAYRFEEG